jgi:hypothetical protein
MSEVYRTLLKPEQPEALVVHCSDARFQVHFQDFLRLHKGIARYALIAVPGGAQFLTAVDYLPKFSWAGWRWTKFMMGIAKPRRVILIAHEDCRWYVEDNFWRQAGAIHDRQSCDLLKVKAAIGQQFEQIPVELYFARLDGDHVLFEAVV